MASEQEKKAFLAEFDALKSKYGKDFHCMKVVSFERDGQPVPEPRFQPQFCRPDLNGFMICVEERPV